MSRKGKDKAALESLKEEPGEYTIRSRNKVADPTKPGSTLPRGSRVTTTMQSTDVVKTQKTPDTSREVTIDVPKTEYKPGDMQTGGVRDRKTTIPLGALLKEKPAKTQMRIDAQKEGKTSYNYKGKEEYSGRNETTYTPKKISVPVPGKETYSKETVTNPVTKVDYPTTKKTGSNKGISMAIRRVSGSDSRGRGQNYKRLDVKVGKKVIPIIKVKTPTRRSN